MAELEFVTPSWLEGQDAETIHERMMENLPEDIDKTEAGFPWDFTMPTALEKAELLEFEMMETTKIMHYMFSYGIYLDYHAKAAGITRKEAEYATGTLYITGSAGLTIPLGFLFAVPASGGSEAITFETTEEVTIGIDGTATVGIQATTAGTNGNTAADTISIMVTPLTGIETITNPEETSGGVEEEDDEALRERITEAYESEESFVGCDSDYQRWAKEIAGVGQVIVIPEWDGPGTVKLVLLDADGEPAAAATVAAVYEYIASPDDRTARLAPIGATVTVVAPEETEITISVTVEFAEDADEDETLAAIAENLVSYLSAARESGEIRRNRVGSVIIGTDGVADYTDLLINGSTAASFTVAQDEYPRLSELTINGDALSVTAE